MTLNRVPVEKFQHEDAIFTYFLVVVLVQKDRKRGVVVKEYVK